MRVAASIIAFRLSSLLGLAMLSILIKSEQTVNYRGLNFVWPEFGAGKAGDGAYASCGICSITQKKKSVFGGSIPNRFSLEAI